MTTRIPQPSGGDQNYPPYDALIAASEREIARRKRELKELRRQRRRARRAEAARFVHTHSRAGIFWIGTTAFSSSMVCFAVGEIQIGTDLLMFAIQVWLMVLGLPRR
ncbi:hypothetical protein [Streptomyces californicus]|uniref:hypothetical protein n=1 Tax=Streptomyces californicus TaxID=67351 RepID=UPI00296FBA68|nr:hypothetical protein [Streptomyces californicus]MDW4918731.1 hypothetical protein [Streptomyces californicus]